MSESAAVVDHYTHPRNVGSLPSDDPSVGTGVAGSAESGRLVRLQVRIDPATGLIVEARFKTLGCGSTIASASLATERLTGRTIAADGVLSADEICVALELPDSKRYCAELAETAARAAIDDYRNRR
jgi:nitrogen fixation NifU-like protein